MSTINRIFTPEDAHHLAAYLHEGQTDKTGNPYIGHLRRVASYVGDEESRIVAYLHDSIEDTGVTAEELESVYMVPAHLTEAVVVLTRTKGISHEEYYTKIRAHRLALEVKLADLADNTDPARRSGLDEKTIERLARKYDEAYRHLGVDASDGDLRRSNGLS